MRRLRWTDWRRRSKGCARGANGRPSADKPEAEIRRGVEAIEPCKAKHRTLPAIWNKCQSNGASRWRNSVKFAGDCFEGMKNAWRTACPRTSRSEERRAGPEG